MSKSTTIAPTRSFLFYNHSSRKSESEKSQVSRIFKTGVTPMSIHITLPARAWLVVTPCNCHHPVSLDQSHRPIFLWHQFGLPVRFSPTVVSWGWLEQTDAGRHPESVGFTLAPGLLTHLRSSAANDPWLQQLYHHISHQSINQSTAFHTLHIGMYVLGPYVVCGNHEQKN